MNRFRILALLTSIVALSACSTGLSPAPDTIKGRVKGNVSYASKLVMPERSELFVRLVDMSLPDTPVAVMSEVRLAGKQPSPIAFVLPFSPAWINETGSYGVRALVYDLDGKLRFATPAPVPVLTKGHGDRVEAVLQPVP